MTMFVTASVTATRVSRKSVSEGGIDGGISRQNEASIMLAPPTVKRVEMRTNYQSYSSNTINETPTIHHRYVNEVSCTEKAVS
jgi:hypothetical protein